MTTSDSMTRTRDAILRAAASALRTHERAGMADIAAAAGVGRATLYRHFANREDLLVELGRFAAEESIRVIDAARIDGVPVREGLARMVRALLTVGREFWVVSRHRAQLWPEEEEVGVRLRVLAERGQRDGLLRADLPADHLSTLLGSLVLGALSIPPLSELGVEDATDTIVSVFLDGSRA
ncbi:TetR/AcrR family transcriptional regulator [Nonomuraea sp. NN258]|uniref:TetR/AcrR family transcriptional regulator n=1 Tax=Nonomuraea antri TaxID=2730852 RepID=UPI001569F172|nr:TetR/AcrR family transcriptional regulator [Nonomuraea antri]NRQ32811.1 TetR/AcrR family transcriptional regulator [Nonomuraea antri]